MSVKHKRDREFGWKISWQLKTLIITAGNQGIHFFILARTN